jgi:DNA polymerase III delta prime subunit
MSGISFHPEIEASMRSWLQKRDAPAFLLLGPPGVGKTTLTYRVAKMCGYFIKEYNASHVRTGSVFRTQLLPQLAQNGITSLFHSDCPNGKLLLLDEIDGMSQGERGGLQELLTYLRQKNVGPCPLVLICNEIRGRTMQQLQKICCSHLVQKPARPLVETYLGKNLPDAWYNTGDLRRMLRWSDGIEVGISEPEPVTNQVTDPNHSQESLWAAWHTLYESWDLFEELELETKDTNLAGLLFHENLPKRLTGYSFDDYLKVFDMLNASDRADYWAFFHQCWSLLTPSYVLKLKLPNMILNNYPIKPIHGKVPTSQQLQYTQVLTKQSLLFNVWKEMCRLFDTENISIRVQPTFVAQPGIPEKTVSTIGLVGDLEGGAVLTSAAVETEVKPKATRVRKVAIKKTALASTTSSLSSDLQIQYEAIAHELDKIAESGRSSLSERPTQVGQVRELDKVAESNHCLVQGVRPNGLTREPHQDTKTKKRSKKLDVQGAVLAL